MSVQKNHDDNPEWTPEDFAQAQPATKVLPADVLAAFNRPRGRPKAGVTKVAVKLRIDPDVLAKFKAKGAGWQTAMNDALRAAADAPERKKA